MYNSAGVATVPVSLEQRPGGVPAVLSSDFVHEPFHTDQVSFDILAGLEGVIH
eukprot:gene24122-29809_t